MRLVLLFFLLLTSLFAFDVKLSTDEVANGKTALIEFSSVRDVKLQKVVVGKKAFQIFAHPLDATTKYALIPMSYYEKRGSKKLTVEYLKGGKKEVTTLKLKVVSGEYAQEEIVVDAKKVNPKSKAVLKRISQEYKEAMRIYGTITPKSYIKEPFILPLESKITSNFGKARVYNGSLKGYHSGTDFRASMGTPIIAANDAKVALVKERFYSGGTVLLNHGEGIYTCYFHMSKFFVKEGEMVKRGDLLGLSGASGRVTGPHLHFSARIAGVQVDPLQLIKLINTKLLQGN